MITNTISALNGMAKLFGKSVELIKAGETVDMETLAEILENAKLILDRAVTQLGGVE